MDHSELVLSCLDTTRRRIDEATAALIPGVTEPQAAGFALVRAIDALDEAFNAWCTPAPTARKPAPVIDLAEQRRIRRSDASGPRGELGRRCVPPALPTTLREHFTLLRGNNQDQGDEEARGRHAK